MQPKLMSNDEIQDTIDERDRYLDALRQIQSIPYYDLADNAAALVILDIVSKAIKPEGSNAIAEPPKV